MAVRRSIAIVDDDGLVRSALSSLARSYGLDVTVFASAEDFLLASAGDFDCVLSDIQMPGITGLELQRRLQTLAPQLPIVIMTALNDPRLRTQALDAGACGFLDKPFETEAVVAALETVFGPL